ncbi:hypothetical protein ACA910_005297 [Epithemia clementina (nom. ined.)]
MKLFVKTLTGGKFDVQVEESNTVAEVKTIIEASKSDLPAASMKLIKSGKVLKDEDVISAIGVKENDFLVVMIAKPKKPAAPAASAPKASTPASAAPAPEPAAPAVAASSSPAPSASAATTTPAPTATTTTTPAAPAAGLSSDFPAEVIGNLTGMGFPEEEVRHCLRAAQGNPDMAVEFLTNGIPEGINLSASTSPTPAASSSSSSSGTLQALRNHPQFNDLRRLVQSNPQMLQSVLSQIGQQQPQLLQEINDNQALFLQMMNEPVIEGSGSGSASASDASAPSSNSAGSAGSGSLGGALGGLGNPAQMAQMINSMSAEELQQMSTMMGLSPDQLRATAQMIGQMPPEQLQQFMMQAMGGVDGSGGGGMGAPQVLRLTDDEMAAVDRLTEMGFDRAEAAQAFLACDKNEALAANLLMDSMGEDGGFFAGGGGGDNDEDMYD